MKKIKRHKKPLVAGDIVTSMQNTIKKTTGEDVVVEKIEMLERNGGDKNGSS